MRAMLGRPTRGVFTEIFLCLALAFAMTACGGADDRQPNLHSRDLAAAAAVSIRIPVEAKIKITDASKKSYKLQIIYPHNSGYSASAMASDATNLVRAMLRKLVDDGQKPHDQETEISVWALEIEPGKIGESGHHFDPSEHYFIWASYNPPSDNIGYEECTEFVDQWRDGHCS
jgi:hypothetical protein